MAKGGYRGGMPMGGMNQMQMMKQAQKMQENLMKMQEELQAKEYEATAGGGVITAVCGGNRELKSITIDPEAVDPEDVEMLQDMIVAAVNEAMRKAEADQSANMAKLTGGLNLGGQFGVGRGFVGVVIICLEVNGVFFAVQGKLEAGVRVVVQRISVAALRFRQRTHGVDELKIQSASRGGVFGFQILVVEVHLHVHIAGIGVAHADGHVVGVDAHVFNHEVGTAILRPQLELSVIASLNAFGVDTGSSIVSNVVGTVVSSIGLSAELDHFHVLDFGGGGKESGGAKVSV